MADALRKKLFGTIEMKALRTSVFLDRDGVIIHNRPDHVKSWSEVRFLPGALDALKRLAEYPSAIVIISNQGAVGRGMITLEEAWDLQNRIVEEIRMHGGRIDGSYICPHHPNDGCDCRKPSPGMILQAAKDLDIDLRASWLVGDALSDIEAAEKVQVHGILVRTGRGEDQLSRMPAETSAAWPVVADLAAAVELIFNAPGVHNRV
jgi:D-glycero-D-manno-heptose 1,7-bisphosphate phosphatase